MDMSFAQVPFVVDDCVSACHGAAAAAGWWGTPDGRIADPRLNPMGWSNKLMLTVSELAESMEGDRKNLADDKLPQYPMREVELADAFIRICDMAGAYGVPLGEIVQAKLLFNAQRADHKVENRVAEGGKAY